MQNPFVQTYSPGDMVVTFKGIEITGFGESDIVSCKRNNMVFTQQIGCDGEATHVKSADQSGEVKITVKQTSGANARLGAILKLDELIGGQIGPILIFDNNGHTVWAGQGRIAGWPEEVKRGKDAGDQVWTLICPAIDFEFSPLPASV